jgi:hypothetical protein
MSTLTIIKEYQIEAENWLHTLGFYQQENVTFKTTLSDKVNASTDSTPLIPEEQFNESFVEQDYIIRFLTDEVKEQLKLLAREVYEDGLLLREIERRQRKLRKDMKKEEDIFDNLRSRFLSYIENQVSQMNTTDDNS